MKSLWILIALISGGTSPLDLLAQNQRVDCANIEFKTRKFYISLEDSVLHNTISYQDSLPLAYPTFCLNLEDTAQIRLNSTFSNDSCFIFTGLAQGEFSNDDTVEFSYNLVFKSQDFEHNTQVNGNYHLYRIEQNDTICDCYYPIKLILEKTNGSGFGNRGATGVYLVKTSPSTLKYYGVLGSPVKLSAWNLQGKKVLAGRTLVHQEHVDVSHLNNGLYIFELKSTGVRFLQKVTVE